jgi:hypothetical protein
MKCARCRDTYWVCETHDDRPWDGEQACGCGGAGASCRFAASGRAAAECEGGADTEGPLTGHQAKGQSGREWKAKAKPKLPLLARASEAPLRARALLIVAAAGAGAG